MIAVAEAAGFDVFVTTDRSLRYQQNLMKERRLALIVLQTTSWPRIQRVVAVVVAIDADLRQPSLRWCREWPCPGHERLDELSTAPADPEHASLLTA